MCNLMMCSVLYGFHSMYIWFLSFLCLVFFCVLISFYTLNMYVYGLHVVNVSHDLLVCSRIEL